MINAISLFAGCGGCSLGLKQAGYAVRLAVDINADACATYAKNFAAAPIWQTDLAQIQPTDLLQRAGLQSTEVGLIVGGPPCQGFSSAGARDWADPRNALLKRFVEIVIALRPTWFVMENVEGLLTAKEGFYLIEALTHFLAAGYWVRAQKVYLEQHGLPQKRKRVLVVGNLEQRAFEFPLPSYVPAQPLTLFEDQPQRTLMDAIGDLPAPAVSGTVIYAQTPRTPYQASLRRTDGQAVQQHQLKQVNAILQQRINLLRPGETMKHLPAELQHPSFQRRALRRVLDGTPTEKRGGAPTGLKRLWPDHPALTITSAAPAEFIHPTENRLLTLRECARLQSFPDWFEFAGSWSAIATQIGNAIPPLFMQTLAQHILATATWQPAPNPTGRWLGIETTKATAMSPALENMLICLQQKTYAYAR